MINTVVDYVTALCIKIQTSSEKGKKVSQHPLPTVESFGGKSALTVRIMTEIVELWSFSYIYTVAYYLYL
jgi:hypothetical protein